MTAVIIIYLLIGFFVLAVIAVNTQPFPEASAALAMFCAIIVLTWPLVVALAFQP